MGTIERGESNLSFQNIAKVAATLGVTLSTLFAGLEGKAQILRGTVGQKGKEPLQSTKTRTAKSAPKAY